MKKRQYSKESIDKAIEFVKNKQGSIRLAAKTFGVPRTSIVYKIAHPDTKFKSGPDSVLSLEEEKVLVDYIISLSSRGFPRKKEDILDSVQYYLKENPRPNPFKDGRPGDKWFSSFMKRHPILATRTAEGVTKASACVSEEDIRKWFSEISKYFEEQGLTEVIKDPTRIYNADETCFLICPKTGKVISQKGAKNVYFIEKASSKENITVMFAFSASGRTCVPMIIYPYVRIPDKVKDSVPRGWGIGRSDNGWMTAPVFYEYISNVFHKDLIAAGIKFPVILYVDGHKTHLTKEVSELCKSLKIHLIALYPNATRILQPADVASFKPLKSGWKKYLRLWYAENECGEVLNKQNFAPLLQKVVNSCTDPSIAINGFRSTGLFPLNPDAINYEKCLGSRRRRDSANADTSVVVPTTLTFYDFKAIVGEDRIKSFESAYAHDQTFENQEFQLIYCLWKKFLGYSTETEVRKTQEKNEDTELLLDEFTGKWQKPEEGNLPKDDVTEPQPSTSKEVNEGKVTIISDEPFSEFLKRRMWPTSPKRKGKRQIERIPYALTSDEYLRLMKEKDEKKKQIQEEKENKKRLREEKKILTGNRKNKGVGKKTKQSADTLQEAKNQKSETFNDEMTESVLSHIYNNTEKILVCAGCCRSINNKSGLECGMCDKKFHHSCIPANHKIHIPEEEGDDFVCHYCYQVNTSGSSTEECFKLFQEEAKKNGFY